MPEEEIKVRLKCPHCGLPLHVVVDRNLSQYVTIRLKGAAPVKKGTETGEEPEED